MNGFEEGRQIFVEEGKDLLRSMEAALLTLESQPDDVEAMNALFRAAHTIKGSAGLFALDNIVSFTHVLENVLDRVRAGQQRLDSGLSELALRCADHIGTLLDVVSATGGDAGVAAPAIAAGQALLAALHGYLGDTVALVAAAADHDLAEVAAAPAGPLVARDVWHLSLRFGPDLLRNGIDPLSFVGYLGTIGQIERIVTVADHLPPLERFDAETCYLGFELLLRTDADQQTIADVFEFVLDESRVQLSPPHASHAACAALLAAMPEPPDRAAALLLEVGALLPEELAAVRAWHSAEPASPLQAPAAVGEPARAAGRASEAGRFIRVPADKLDRLIALVGELVIAGSGSTNLARAYRDPALQESAATVDALVEAVREEALRLRMVQVGETFQRFDRVVRDVSRELGKEIALVVSGGETELDKSMVERINDPLTHLVRNAIDHGIEDRQARLAAGKPAGGQIRLHAHHDAGSVVIEVGDDGRGLDRAKLLAKGRERGLVAPDEMPSDQEIMGLIFEPGFSTAAKITNLSGRGVGMDVVRRNIHDLRGTVALASVPGQGTTISIRLPLTLALIDGFLVRVGRNSYVVPLNTVSECIELPADCRAGVTGGDLLNLRGQVLPLLRLREVFQLAGQPTGRQNVVVIDNGGQRAGLVVDQLLGERQAVIKPLGKLFASVPGIGGSTVLGNGEVALILDVPSLIRRARTGGAPRLNRLHRASLALGSAVETTAKGCPQ
jgi:two-component system chemotaxis sensor kinase CheA